MTGIATQTSGGSATSTWANLIRDATVQVLTSSTRPGSPAEGMVIYETDTDLLQVYNGSAWVPYGNVGAWTAFTAQARGGTTARAGTTNWGRYIKQGRRLKIQVHWQSTVTVGSPGQWGFDLPASLVPAAAFELAVGEGYLYTGGIHIRAVVVLANGTGGSGSTALKFVTDDTTASTGYSGALASGDAVTFSCELETTT